ncbi:ROK family protein [Nakamurella endophytica]|uniref:Glucokinase n=1 Tax=Nakamurella endophytica TaxID=1748367 RepID=A0A917T941_9ACTN|nr:ROK family protein [Nakamurella endophytica]GGM15017.1 glucokinase [Nakamurella endophytica]
MTVIGVDIGGTKIDAGVFAVDRAAGGHPRWTLLDRVTAPTPRTGGPDVLSGVAGLVDTLRDRHGDCRAVGVGAPGVVDGDGTVRVASAVLPGWAGTPVGRRLRSRLGVPVVVDNDVRAMARAEASIGAGRTGRVLHLSVGTGVGGAVSQDGRVDRGPRGTAGEVAHLTVAATGPLPCGCDARDHLESVLAGPALAAAWRSRTGRPDGDLWAAAAGGVAGGVPDAALVRQVALEVVAAAGTLAGRALAGLVCAADLDRIVVAGGVARLGEVLLGPLRDGLAAAAWPRDRRTAVVPAALGDRAALAGAALLAASAVPERDGGPDPASRTGGSVDDLAVEIAVGLGTGSDGGGADAVAPDPPGTAVETGAARTLGARVLHAGTAS